MGKFESGSNKHPNGNYEAVGQLTKKGNRAYGKYQVMDYNIPTWTKEVIGRALTIEEFLADHEAQDLVAGVRLTQYIAKYGTHEDAAATWFSGGPLAKNWDKCDVNGTCVPDYVAGVLALR